MNSPLNPDETMRLPVAYRANLIMAAMAKRWLAADKLPLNERLLHLEGLDKLAFGVLTAEAIAVIKPANDVFEQIFNQAMQVDTGENQAATAFGILERDDVFRDLLRLNPSLVTAIKLCRRYG
jgi:hypothetical protein